MTGHTAAAGLVVASQCRSVSTRGRCERCGQCASRSAALGPSEGPGFGGCATCGRETGWRISGAEHPTDVESRLEGVVQNENEDQAQGLRRPRRDMEVRSLADGYR